MRKRFVLLDKYYNLIANAYCLLALTNEDDCLQSDAYEALSLEVPLVISDTRALKNYFKNTAVYTSHNPGDIYKSVLTALEIADDLKENCKEIKLIRNKEFKDSIKKIRQLVDD